MVTSVQTSWEDIICFCWGEARFWCRGRDAAIWNKMEKALRICLRCSIRLRRFYFQIKNSISVVEERTPTFLLSPKKLLMVLLVTFNKVCVALTVHFRFSIIVVLHDDDDNIMYPSIYDKSNTRKPVMTDHPPFMFTQPYIEWWNRNWQVNCSWRQRILKVWRNWIKQQDTWNVGVHVVGEGRTETFKSNESYGFLRSYGKKFCDRATDRHKKNSRESHAACAQNQ